MPNGWTIDQMSARLVRYDDLRPCLNAFVDTYTPGSDKKENFTIIGPGVAEHPDQYVHIREPHGFNIGGARQPPGCTNSQHSHETEEVFIVHSGQWAFRWGVDANDGEAVLGPGDCISIPVNVFRGFENVGTELGYLFAVLGGNDPGHVTWAPDVFVKAKDYGLVLLENGNLVDTTKGEQLPADTNPMPVTSAAQVAAHRRMTAAEMADCVVLADKQRSSQDSLLSANAPGVVESPIIGPPNASEAIASGKLAWPHGFHLRRLDFAPGAALGYHARFEQEVIYIHSGTLRFSWADGDLILGPGDVLTVPMGLSHGYAAEGAAAAVAYVVRGGDQPAAPQFQSHAVA